MTALDLPNQTVFLDDGQIIKYKHCISSMPLDYTLRLINRDDLADRLLYSSTHIVGIGLRGKSPHGRKCWFYYPELTCAFYRCSCFSSFVDTLFTIHRLKSLISRSQVCEREWS